MILCFAGFLSAVALCVRFGISLAPAMMVGLILFFGLGIHRGYQPNALCRMAWKKGRESLKVVQIFMIIGCITALWRASGTISFFLYYGLKCIPPQLFLLLAFLMTSVLSFMLGSAFGVCGTAGIVLITLARSGGVDPTITAGAIIAGAFFGDRNSPMSSIANFVSGCTGTDLYDNVRRLLKTAVLPLLLSIAFYAVMAVRHPLWVMDESVLNTLKMGFVLSWPVLIPALIMIVLPILRVPVRRAMAASAAAAFFIAVTLQHAPVLTALRAAILGFSPAQPELQGILSGGGMVSMLNAAAVVLIASLYAGILEGIDALAPLKEKADALVDRLGLFPATLLVSLMNIMIFCNQVAMTIMDEQILSESYRKRGASQAELAVDISNTGVLFAGLVPWSVGATVPMGMLDVDYRMLPYGVFLYLVPICYLFTRKWFISAMQEA